MCQFCKTETESNFDYDEQGKEINGFFIQKIVFTGNYKLRFGEDGFIGINYCPLCGKPLF